MKIFTINEQLINKGRANFTSTMCQYLCGPASPHYDDYAAREGGLSAIPGAIIAAIEIGLVEEEEIVPAVTRVSRCREQTVMMFLEHLEKGNSGNYLWERDENGIFTNSKNPESAPFTVIAY